MANFEIRITDSSNDWAHWCQEKAGYILENLSRMADVIIRMPAGAEREVLEANLYPAVFDALKMIAFATGHNLTGEELHSWRTQLCSFGSTAYPIIAAGIGLEVRDHHQEHNERLRELLGEADVCLALPRSEGRTRLHVALLKASAEGGAVVNSLLNRIELVTMGELSWEAYVAETRPVLSELKRLNRID